MSINDVDALTKAVLSEAHRDSERLLENAEVTARQIRDQAASDAMAEEQEIIAEAEAKAARAMEEARATGRLEAQQITLGGRESLLDDVFAAVAGQLGDPTQIDNYDGVARALLREAVAQLNTVGDLVVLADPVTREVLTPSVLRDLSQELACELSMGDVLDNEVGVIVQSKDGRVSYDNTFQERLARQRPGLRSEVFAILKGHDV